MSSRACEGSVLRAHERAKRSGRWGLYRRGWENFGVEFGIFHEFERLPGSTEAQAFDAAFALVDAAEQWGLDAVWLAELHFAPKRSVLSAPLTIASAIAA